MNQHGSIWTKPRVEMLKAMWADGLSGALIAHEFGLQGVVISRNAVVGKAVRLGLAREQRSPLQSIRRHPGGVNRIFERKTKPLPELTPALSANPVTLMGLESRHCRWPLGEPSHDMLYCGDTAELDQPYCSTHCRLAYQAIERQRPFVWRDRTPRARTAAI